MARVNRAAELFDHGSERPQQRREALNSEPLVIAGILALALGTVLIYGARRRSGAKAAAEAVSTSV